MAVDAGGGIEIGDRNRSATGGGNFYDCGNAVGSKDDGAIRIPGTAAAEIGVGNVVNGAAVDVGAFEFAGGEERDGVAVRRPESVPEPSVPGRILPSAEDKERSQRRTLPSAS